MTPPAEALLGGAADLWRSAGRGGGWATAAALVVLLVAHLTVLLVRRRRRDGRIAGARTAAAVPASASTGSDSGLAPPSSIEGLVTEDDLRQLVSSLGVGARDPEREGWDHVIAKQNDAVSYRAWCDNTVDGPPKYLSITTYERCSAELLRDFYMDNEYRMEWDNTVTKHEQLQYDENSGVEVGRTVKKFPLLTPPTLLGISQFPQDLEAAIDASHPTPQNTAASDVTSTQTARTSSCKLPVKKTSRQMIASGLLLAGSIVCLSRGRSNLGLNLACERLLSKRGNQAHRHQGKERM
ncbi:hypothetical protein PR202_gb08479 [Eleusine coracana subsp. coracana]|uniref:START domain-containing protein n=1 Tax=Eleusine coracana subsp. coracana TaxID=191504 RepID=A0AAV5EEP9_ELECO|nr:hypothetical protein PR202_gb08479 [Eleusine coracana subsp. coracana]